MLFEELDAEQVPATDIVFECPHCGKSLSIDPLGAGIVITCTQCGRAVTVPVPDGMDISAIDGPPPDPSAETEPRHEAAAPVSDVVQHRVPFGEAVRRWFHTFRLSGFSGRGRESRSEYWCGYAFLVAVYLGLVVSSFGLLALCGLGDGLRMPGRAFALFLGYIGAIHAIRRAHDSGRSGWWLLVPVYGLVLLFLPSQKAENRFGPVPNTAPAASPRRWKTIARTVLAASAILYAVFSAKTVAVGRRWTQATVRGQTIALTVSIENRDRESQNARTLWQVSGAATADDYFAALRDAGVDGLPDDTSGWHVLAGPAGLPGETPFLVSANLGLTTEDLSAYAPLLPNDLGDRLDKSVRPFGRDAVCVVSRAGEVRMLPAAHGLATDSAMFGFLPAAVVRQLAVLPATLDSRPNGKPARTAPASEDEDGSAEGDEPATDGETRIAVEPTDEGEADADEDEAGTDGESHEEGGSTGDEKSRSETANADGLYQTDEIDGYLLCIIATKTVSDKDPVRLAKKFIRALASEDGDMLPRFFVDEETASNMLQSQKHALLRKIRNGFVREHGFNPRASKPLSYDFLDPATITAGDGRFPAISRLFLEDHVDVEKLSIEWDRATLALVLVGFENEAGDFKAFPLFVRKNENGTWSLFVGFERTEVKTPEELYREMPEKEFLAECATFRDVSGIGKIDESLREKLIGQLLFRDICRTNGVPDEALKDSFASGGLDVDGLAKSIKSRMLFNAQTNALEKCLDLAGIGEWKRNELKIRSYLKFLTMPDRNRAMPECSGKDEATAEALALEASEIVRILSSIGGGKGTLPDESFAGGTPESSSDYAERLATSAKLDGVAAKWIRELGRWGIAWNAPSNAPSSTPALVSPRFPCGELAADETRLREEVDIGIPFVIVGLDGSIRKSLPENAELRHVCGMGGGFSELLPLRYLTPSGIVKPKGNRHWEWGAKWNLDRDSAALGAGFVDARAAFARFGGYPLLMPPVEGIGFVGDFQRNVPLVAKYRYFETADLEYSHGALVAFTLKARFGANYKPTAIDAELQRVKDDFAKRMEELERRNASVKFAVVRSGSDGTGPIVNDLAWPVEVNIGSTYPFTINTEFKIRRESDGTEISMSVSGKGLVWLLENALARMEYEDGDDLPELEEDAARTPDGNDLPELEADADKTPEQRAPARPELRKGFKRMSAALETVKSVPSFKNVLAMETVWDSLPEDGRSKLQEPVWSASCAWLLASGNKSAVVERKPKLDWDAFWPSVSDVCSRCKGTGRTDKDRNCFKCLGLGRTVSDGEDGKCMAVFGQNVESALRICRGE